MINTNVNNNARAWYKVVTDMKLNWFIMISYIHLISDGIEYISNETYLFAIKVSLALRKHIHISAEHKTPSALVRNIALESNERKLIPHRLSTVCFFSNDVLTVTMYLPSMTSVSCILILLSHRRKWERRDNQNYAKAWYPWFSNVSWLICLSKLTKQGKTIFLLSDILEWLSEYKDYNF